MFPLSRVCSCGGPIHAPRVQSYAHGPSSYASSPPRGGAGDGTDLRGLFVLRGSAPAQTEKATTGLQEPACLTAWEADRTHRCVELVLVVDVGTLVDQAFETLEVIRASRVVNGCHLVVVCSLDISAVLVQHVN